MPFINGRFYASPIHGHTLERARQAEGPEFEDAFERNEPSAGAELEDEFLPNNPRGESGFEELAAQQAEHKRRLVPRHAHAPNSSYVAEYPHEKKIGGSASRRNNNPGNIMYGEKDHGFARRNGAIGKDYAGRAIFPSMESGEQAQRALWNEFAQKGLTIDQAGRTWTGGDPPDTRQKYVQGLSHAAGVPPGTPLSRLTPEQFNRIINAQTRHEGFSPGVVEKRGKNP